MFWGYESQASTAVPGDETYQRLISQALRHSDAGVAALHVFHAEALTARSKKTKSVQKKLFLKRRRHPHLLSVAYMRLIFVSTSVIFEAAISQPQAGCSTPGRVWWRKLDVGTWIWLRSCFDEWRHCHCNGSPGNALCPQFILQVLLFPRDLDDPGRWQPIGFRCVTTPTTGSYQGRSLIVQVWRGKLRQLRSVGNLHTKNACIASFMKSYSPAEMLGLNRICHCNTRMWHSRFPVLFFQ